MSKKVPYRPEFGIQVGEISLTVLNPPCETLSCLPPVPILNTGTRAPSHRPEFAVRNAKTPTTVPNSEFRHASIPSPFSNPFTKR
jgi:hypothetical protein